MIYFTFAHRFFEFILRRLYSVSSTECSLDGTRRRQNRTTTEKHRAEQTQTSDCSDSRTYLGASYTKDPHILSVCFLNESGSEGRPMYQASSANTTQNRAWPESGAEQLCGYH